MGDAAMPKLKLEWSEAVTRKAEIEIADDEIERFRSEMTIYGLIKAVLKLYVTPLVEGRPEYELLSFEIEKADGTKVYISDRR